MVCSALGIRSILLAGKLEFRRDIIGSYPEIPVEQDHARK
jgi:hypothetical protein